MPVSLYEISIPVFIKLLRCMSSILTKSAEHAAKTSTPESEYTKGKLIDGMLPLTFQVATMSNSAKFVAVRVCGAEPLPMADDEVTFEDLQARIKRTIEYLEKVKPDSSDGKEETEVVIKTFKGEHKFSAKSYLLEFAMPNFYFHYTTAYDILRSKGVEIGKWDFLVPPQTSGLVG